MNYSTAWPWFKLLAAELTPQKLTFKDFTAQKQDYFQVSKLLLLLTALSSVKKYSFKAKNSQKDLLEISFLCHTPATPNVRLAGAVPTLCTSTAFLPSC